MIEIDYFRETNRELMEFGRWCRVDSVRLNFPGTAPFAHEMKREIESTLPVISDEEALKIEIILLEFRLYNHGAYRFAIEYFVKNKTIDLASTALRVTPSKARRDRDAVVNFTMARLYDAEQITEAERQIKTELINRFRGRGGITH